MQTSRLIEYLGSHGFIEPRELPREYFYASLPLCVVDAVFSIGIQYKQTERVVQNVARNLSLPIYRDRAGPAPKNEHPTTDEFIALVGDDAEHAAVSIYEDRHRTSSVSGILKAEAVSLFCKALSSAGVKRFADLLDGERAETARKRIALIAGQGSGISWGYFLMLAGDDRKVKPDRMVMRFMEEALGEKTTPAEAEMLVVAAADAIAAGGVSMTPRQLDYIIWDYQSNKARYERFSGEMLPAEEMVKFSALVKDGTIPLSNKPGKPGTKPKP